MGFRYPHYEAEFGLGVAGVCLLEAILMPVSRGLPSWAGVLLLAVPPVLLLAWCAWTWYRVRHE